MAKRTVYTLEHIGTTLQGQGLMEADQAFRRAATFRQYLRTLNPATAKDEFKAQHGYEPTHYYLDARGFGCYELGPVNGSAWVRVSVTAAQANGKATAARNHIKDAQAYDQRHDEDLERAVVQLRAHRDEAWVQRTLDMVVDAVMCDIQEDQAVYFHAKARVRETVELVREIGGIAERQVREPAPMGVRG